MRPEPAERILNRRDHLRRPTAPTAELRPTTHHPGRARSTSHTEAGPAQLGRMTSASAPDTANSTARYAVIAGHGDLEETTSSQGQVRVRTASLATTIARSLEMTRAAEPAQRNLPAWPAPKHGTSTPSRRSSGVSTRSPAGPDEPRSRALLSPRCPDAYGSPALHPRDSPPPKPSAKRVRRPRRLASSRRPIPGAGTRRAADPARRLIGAERRASRER